MGSEMASTVVWLLTALVILATVCVGVFKRILGDSVSFSKGPREFLLDRLARYGDPFTITMMGKTQTVFSSPETIKFVLSTAHASFPDDYPVQINRLLSREIFVDARHPHFRKIMVSAASGEGLQKLLPFISSLAEKTVKSWENQAVVDSVEELEKFVFTVAMRIIWRDVEPGSEEMDQIRDEVSGVTEGLAVLPINFPGFSFHKALKTKQVLLSRIQREISKRRKAGIQQDDVLNALMSITEVEVPDNDICCITSSMMFAASETSAALIPWVLKYLDDFPEARQRVQDEQDRLQQKMIEDKSLAWFKPKSSMPYTLQVIYEVLRIEFILALPRKANKDVYYNGQVFRKGSYVSASATCVHYDPKYHPNPWEFNPSRFDLALMLVHTTSLELVNKCLMTKLGKPNPNTFLAFGQGAQLCPGSDLALTETMFIIHHLITNYSWKRCGHDKGVMQVPLRKLVGFPISLIKRSVI